MLIVSVCPSVPNNSEQLKSIHDYPISIAPIASSSRIYCHATGAQSVIAA